MKRINFDNKIVLLLNYIFTLIFITIVLKLNKLQLVFYISIVPFILLLLIKNIKKNKIGKLLILIIFFSTTNVLINYITIGGNFSFSYFKKVIMYVMTIIYFDLLSNYKLDINYQLKHIKVINNFLILFLTMLFLLKHTSMYVYKGKVIDALCFNFTNPNLTALFLLALFIFELTFIKSENKKIYKFAEIIFSIIILYFIYLTKSRTALLSAILFLVIFTIFNNVNLFRKKTFVLLVAILPIIFSTSYMYAINNQKVIEKLQMIPTLEDGIDSRLDVWKVAYSGIKKSPIIGAYNEISFGTGQSQMHNSHLDIFASYGFLPFILFIVYLYKLMKFNTNKNYVYLYGFASFVFCGCLEASLFSGSAGLFIYVGNLLMLTNSNNVSDKEAIL